MKKLAFFALFAFIGLASAFNLTNITGTGNLSVIDHTAQYFSGLQDVFGDPYLFGAVFLLFFGGMMLILRVSLDLAVVAGIPLLIMLDAYGWLPKGVTYLVYIAIAAIVAIAILHWGRR